MISNKFTKTEQPKINFYYEDIITYIKKQKTILNLQNNSKLVYNQTIQNEYNNYLIIGQSIWNRYLTQNPWNQLWKNTFYSYSWPENNNIFYFLLHNATRTNDHMYRWTNQKHLKSPKCKLCEKTENINHLYLECKRNKTIWNHFQKYYKNLTKKEYTPLQHILTISALSLPPKTKKLVLTLTITILTHIWKTKNKLQFDNTIIPTTNTIINIKNDMKDIIQTHYKQHEINNTIDEFKTNLCIKNTLCKITRNSLAFLL